MSKKRGFKVGQVVEVDARAFGEITKFLPAGEAAEPAPGVQPALNCELQYTNQPSVTGVQQTAEPTVAEAERFIRKMEKCTSIGAKLILLKNFIAHAAASQSLKSLLPATFYADRDIEFRITMLVKSWQKTLRINQELEAAASPAEPKDLTIYAVDNEGIRAEKLAVPHSEDATLQPVITVSHRAPPAASPSSWSDKSAASEDAPATLGYEKSIGEKNDEEVANLRDGKRLDAPRQLGSCTYRYHNVPKGYLHYYTKAFCQNWKAAEPAAQPSEKEATSMMRELLQESCELLHTCHAAIVSPESFDSERVAITIGAFRARAEQALKKAGTK